MDTRHRNVDLERLFKLRLVVARHGEMDAARWWNTQGMLGRRGALVLKRGFPSTHLFVQARVVFEVAKSRCREIFDPPRCMTLWSLPAAIEDQFEEQWQEWLDDKAGWGTIFDTVQAQSGSDLLTSLRELDLINEEQIEKVRTLRRTAENRAVHIGGIFGPGDDIITLLAAAFSRGEVGHPSIPYARLEP
ncbi:MAG: BrxE family protein [Chloroflexota bacterium]|nr:BrxE family protein [Chloroflexota bacterium]